MHPPLIKGSNTCAVWPTVISSRSDSKVASFLNNPEAAGRESPDLRVKESYQLSLQSLDSYPDLYECYAIYCGWSLEGSGTSSAIYYSDSALTLGKNNIE